MSKYPKHPGDPRDLMKVLYVEGRRDVYYQLTEEQLAQLDTLSAPVVIPSAIQGKTPQDLIIYMDKTYYYLTKAALQNAATVVVPGVDLEAGDADSLRRRGTIVAHMDEQPPTGEWTTLVNLDAIIAGVEDTQGNGG